MKIYPFDNGVKLLRFCPTPLVQLNHAKYLDRMNRLSELCTKPYQEYVNSMKSENTSWVNIPYMLAIVMSPNIVSKRQAETSADIKITRLVMALKKYKVEKGAYPETIDPVKLGLEQNDAIDPFTGAPLVYVPKDEVFIIYSKGGNGESALDAKDASWKLIWRSKICLTNEELYTLSKGIVLGEHLAGKIPGAKALLVVDNIPNNKSQDILVAALKEGVGGKITVVAEDSPVPDAQAKANGATTSAGSSVEWTSLRKTMKASDFDAMIKRHPDCNLVVSLIGLPKDLEDMEFWDMGPTQPKIAIIIADKNNWELKSSIVLSGLVEGLVICNTKTQYDDESPTLSNSSPQKAFDERFLLVTPENLKSVISQHPVLFGY